MSLTKAESRTLIQQLIDDPDAARWTADNLDILASVTLDKFWAELLIEAPYLRSTLQTLTSLNAPGYINIAPGGDLSERFFRVQKITRNGTEYSPGLQKDFVIEDEAFLASQRSQYFRLGSQLWLSPLDTTTDVEIHYSSHPAMYDGLGESATVVWPDGHEEAWIYAVAARALGKGAAEESAMFKTISDDALRLCRASVKKLYPGPMPMITTDSPVSWGSQT